MILTCPNCDTQYVVKDGAVPPEGRQVRCAACKHSWHQDPENQEPLELDPQAAVDQPVADDDAGPDGAADDESLAEATLIEPRSGPEAEERAYEEAVIEGGAEVSPEATIVAPEPTRNPKPRRPPRTGTSRLMRKPRPTRSAHSPTRAISNRNGAVR